MSGFVATHVSYKSADFHLISDSIHDSFTPRHLRSNLTHLTPLLHPQEHVREPSAIDFVEAKRIVAPWPGCLVEIPPDPDRRHIVPPPAGPVTLVCCNTTKGVLNIEVHPSWAPLGAERFLHMVTHNFFSTQVPLFRALKKFLVQFGLAGDPQVQRHYWEMGHLRDDPPWLPLGPPGRRINGIARYQKGYMGYAGAGKNSRDTQLIMALAENEGLGGGSPWEVPFGQVIGQDALGKGGVLDRIYTGYGEKVSQGKIMNRGANYTKAEFPLLDYMTGCVVTVENLPWSYP
eukprot:gene25103-30319_t